MKEKEQMNLFPQRIENETAGLKFGCHAIGLLLVKSFIFTFTVSSTLTSSIIHCNSKAYSAG